MNDLIARIENEIKKAPFAFASYEDLFSACRNIEEEDFARAHETNVALRNAVGKIVRTQDHTKNIDRDAFFDLYRRTLLFDAPHFLDPYMLYLEIDRAPEERFYQPRRRKLKPLVDALQDLTDGRLDELFLSLPPRIGKTSLLMFYVTWLLGRDAERTNLYSAYSSMITDAFYSGVLEILQDNTTYLWKDVFPSASIVQTDGAKTQLNINRRKRYASLTCRSIDATLNGACDCNGVVISDDLIGGIEEALNKNRLTTKWTTVDNNLIPRAKENAKLIWCGTRWSLSDPIGIRLEMLETDEKFKSRRFKAINLPALDENDESNFEYDYGVGFSTAYYRQRRASFEFNNDMASWMAQYMGEPIERDGALFTPSDFRYYNGVLPAEEPDRIFMAVDPAFGGGDFVAAPVCFQYGGDVYVHDVIYDNGDKRITQPLLANAVLHYQVQAMQIEANKSTESYKDGIAERLKAQKYRLNLTTKAAPPDKAKYQRIFDKAPDIREMMIFRESGKRSKAYSLFMQNVFSYKMFAKNKNDDAPDSLAMAIAMTRMPERGQIFKRTF